VIFAALAAVIAFSPQRAIAQEVPLTRIAQIYGISADPFGEEILYLASERGFFSVGPDGLAQRLSPGTNKFTGFAADPSRSGRFIAAGDATGGTADTLLVTEDFGRSWAAIAVATPPPAFLTLDTFTFDPKQMTGASDAIYRTFDGGLTWVSPGPVPGAVADLAISARYADTLFAGTTTGLFFSQDGGQSWKLALAEGRPTSMVQTMADGRVFAFVIGQGLYVGGDSGEIWALLAAADMFDGALLHLVGNFGGTLFAVTQFMKVLTSDDGGRTWASFMR
jgi:photosystem II stability/assembly factor-like uncharacterized protein